MGSGGHIGFMGLGSGSKAVGTPGEDITIDVPDQPVVTVVKKGEPAPNLPVVVSPKRVVPKKQTSGLLRSKHANRSDIAEYLLEQHGLSVDVNSLTPEKQSWLAFTDSGKLALYGDPTLKKQLRF